MANFIVKAMVNVNIVALKMGAVFASTDEEMDLYIRKIQNLNEGLKRLEA